MAHRGARMSAFGPWSRWLLVAVLMLGVETARATDFTDIVDGPLYTEGDDQIVQLPPVLPLLDDRCVVSILNRTTQVGSNGSWIIDNVPSNFGLVRARATC